MGVLFSAGLRFRGQHCEIMCFERGGGDILGYATTENHITWKAALEELGGERDSIGKFCSSE